MALATAQRASRWPARFTTTIAGFTALDAWLAAGPEPVELVALESSGHYWMPLASHLRRQGVPVVVVNPLRAKYFAKSRLARTKSDPADARSLAELAMREPMPQHDPLAGVELRQAARFVMTLRPGCGAHRGGYLARVCAPSLNLPPQRVRAGSGGPARRGPSACANVTRGRLS